MKEFLIPLLLLLVGSAAVALRTFLGDRKRSLRPKRRKHDRENEQDDLGWPAADKSRANQRK